MELVQAIAGECKYVEAVGVVVQVAVLAAVRIDEGTEEETEECRKRDLEEDEDNAPSVASELERPAVGEELSGRSAVVAQLERSQLRLF